MWWCFKAPLKGPEPPWDCLFFPTNPWDNHQAKLVQDFPSIAWGGDSLTACVPRDAELLYSRFAAAETNRVELEAWWERELWWQLVVFGIGAGCREVERFAEFTNKNIPVGFCRVWISKPLKVVFLSPENSSNSRKKSLEVSHLLSFFGDLGWYSFNPCLWTATNFHFRKHEQGEQKHACLLFQFFLQSMARCSLGKFWRFDHLLRWDFGSAWTA